MEFLEFCGIVAIIYFVLSVVCCWKLYKKMGSAGILAFIPVVSTWVLCKHVWGSGLFMFLFRIPALGPILLFSTYWKLFKQFGKGFTFCLFFTLFCLPLGLAICAFGDAEYNGN